MFVQHCKYKKKTDLHNGRCALTLLSVEIPDDAAQAGRVRNPFNEATLLVQWDGRVHVDPQPTSFCFRVLTQELQGENPDLNSLFGLKH